MGNVDIEIYVSQLISFFENNPNDLMELIGDVQKEEFYQKLREKCIENHNKGEDIVLTKNQIVNIGTGIPISVIKVLKTFKKFSSHKLKYIIAKITLKNHFHQATQHLQHIFLNF